MAVYTPRLSAASLCRLRRLAWAAGSPMTKTLDRLIELFCSRINAQAVCNACRDGSQCDICCLTQRCKSAKKALHPVVRTGRRCPGRQVKQGFPQLIHSFFPLAA
jgi:hypothetical protein